VNNLADLLFNDNFLPAYGYLQLRILDILEFLINQLLKLYLPVSASDVWYFSSGC
jgi:hypothetical protein